MPAKLRAFSQHQLHTLGGVHERSQYEVFCYLNQNISRDQTYPVKIIRCFGCASNATSLFCKNTFAGYLRPLSASAAAKITPDTVIPNPLNYFVVAPDGQRLLDFPEPRTNLIYSRPTQIKIKKFITSFTN
jgi:hypothetical protein